MKRFLNWWFRKHIDGQVEALLAFEKVLTHSLREMEKKNEYMKGFGDGAQYVIEKMESAAKQRTGSSDVVTAEDVQKAKKGMVH